MSGPQPFENLESFCLFFGYTRSGHSLVGTLLDAHPETAIGHEVALFGSFRGPSLDRLVWTSRDELFSRILHRTRYHAVAGHRGTRRGELFPLVPNGAHGRFTNLRVIGTKRGQEGPAVWSRNPAIIDELAELVQLPLRLLHVYRNPWDNIASMSRRHRHKAIGRYFGRAEAVRDFRAQGSHPIHDVALEDLIADPASELRALMSFLDLETDDDYLERCASIIDEKPQASRRERAWTDREIRIVCEKKVEIPWLARYPDGPD